MKKSDATAGVPPEAGPIGGRCAVSADFFDSADCPLQPTLCDGRSRTPPPRASATARGIQYPRHRFSDRLHGWPEAGACERFRSRDSSRRMGRCDILVGRAICAHARPCASLLRTGGIPSKAAQTMGFLLEVACRTPLAAPGGCPALATGFLGHSIATFGELHREVAICAGKFGAGKAGGAGGRLAVSGRDEYPDVVEKSDALERRQRRLVFPNPIPRTPQRASLQKRCRGIFHSPFFILHSPLPPQARNQPVWISERFLAR